MQIRLHRLCKSWDGNPILRDVDFELASGGFAAVVGRSGSGKSTLLHLLAGIDRAESGEIWLDDQGLHALDEAARTLLRRRSVGLVFQQGNLLPSLSVLDNVRLPIELAHGRSPDTALRAAQLLQQLGLDELAERAPDQLSGGEQQRVAVARALAHRPRLVLADEPTASLDADNAAAVMALLIEACRAQGATLLMATHAQEVMGRAEQLWRLERGQLVRE